MSMTAAEFRAMALSMPEAEEREHMGRPDFRVRSKIFATLDDDERFAVLKLTPEQQEMLLDAQREGREAFAPVKGAWGQSGWTQAALARASKRAVRAAMKLAWGNVAPKALLARGSAMSGPDQGDSRGAAPHSGQRGPSRPRSS
jgi:hypothetical protein